MKIVYPKRGPLRNEHVKKACEARERGELVLAGAFVNPVDDLVLVFTQTEVQWIA